MKTIFTFLITILFLSVNIYGQELKFSSVSSTELDKDVRKNGMYAGTIVGDGKDISVYYFLNTKKDGVRMMDYKFGNDLNFQSSADKTIDSETAKKDFIWYVSQEDVEKKATGSERFLKASATFGGGMKISFGKIVKYYTLGIFTDWEFEEEEKIKPKTDEIWRIMPSGYKTTSDYNAMETAYGFSEDLEKYGNPLLAPADARLIAAGTITEKVKLKNPPPTNGNRVAVLAIDAENFDESNYEVYILPYSANTMGSGLGQDDNLTVLFAPLNAPSTVKAHKHLLWKDRKNHFTLMRFSDDLQLVDSVSFLSDLMWGEFEIFNGYGSTFVAGLGKAGFDGWARNGGIQVKKIDGIQITKVKDGKLLYSTMWTDDDLEQKLVVPAGEKNKLSISNISNDIHEIFPLPNGDDFVIGRSEEDSYALQIRPDGTLRAYYKIDKMDAKKNGQYNYQVMVKGDFICWVLNEQPYELTNETHVKVKSSSSTMGAVRTTTTTTTVDRLNEVFVCSQIVKINMKTQEMSNAVKIDGNDFYPQGSYPALFKENAIYFTGRDKGPKGKNIYLARIDI